MLAAPGLIGFGRSHEHIFLRSNQALSAVGGGSTCHTNRMLLVHDFGDGHQFRAERCGRKGWVVPILSGEFFIERRVGYRDGLMGGNLWFMGATADAALLAAERAAEAASAIPGVVLPFPAGVASSGSKAAE